MSIYKPFCRKAHQCIAFNILYLMSYFTVSGIKVLNNNVDLKTRLMKHFVIGIWHTILKIVFLQHRNH